jgi:predicted DsbA family dithiol-disulfide isomerase
VPAVGRTEEFIPDGFVGRGESMSAPVTVVWYTDPHNIWCWGFEPMIRRLEVRYAGQVDLEIRQGGLFEDFSPVREQWARMSGGRWTETVRMFFDAVASQHRMPMASERMTAGVDDFSSTWPACLAAKAADLQGPETGRRYLRALREAWCLDGQPIHRRSVQEAIAAEAGLDVDAFRLALDDGSADAEFRLDRRACRDHDVHGFPTFEVRAGDERLTETVRVDGWQPWEAFDEVLRKLAPHLQPRTIGSPDEAVRDLFRVHPRLATREVAAVLGSPDDDAEILLETLEEGGVVMRSPVGDGLVWETPERATARPSPEGVPEAD